jgi:hypothetical protein
MRAAKSHGNPPGGDEVKVAGKPNIASGARERAYTSAVSSR